MEQDHNPHEVQRDEQQLVRYRDMETLSPEQRHAQEFASGLLTRARREALTPAEDKLIALYFWDRSDDATEAECAKVLGVSLATFKRHKTRALQSLHTFLAGIGFGPEEYLEWEQMREPRRSDGRRVIYPRAENWEAHMFNMRRKEPPAVRLLRAIFEGPEDGITSEDEEWLRQYEASHLLTPR
jgi:hypothetical protein